MFACAVGQQTFSFCDTNGFSPFHFICTTKYLKEETIIREFKSIGSGDDLISRYLLLIPAGHLDNIRLGRSE
jgi:hypothetical protein